MLISFIGQAMANNIFNFCESSNDTNVYIKYDKNIIPDDVVANNMDYVSASHAETSADCCDDECCDADCICAVNGCSSVTFLTLGMDYSEFGLVSEFSYIQQSFAHPKSISTSLYRPPIFTS